MTDDAKHTPGPWEARRIKTRVHEGFDILGPRSTLTGGNPFIAHVGNLAVDPEPNARLITAAPDLFDAVNEALFLLETGRFRPSIGVGYATQTHLDAVLKQLRAAIAKATGQA